jgi:hypothetical protein
VRVLTQRGLGFVPEIWYEVVGSREEWGEERSGQRRRRERSLTSSSVVVVVDRRVSLSAPSASRAGGAQSVDLTGHRALSLPISIDTQTLPRPPVAPVERRQVSDE